MTTEIIKREDLPVVQTPMDLIAEGVRQGTISAKELIELHSYETAHKAKVDYNHDFHGFQRECKVILRTVEGSKAKFAPLDHIRVLLEPLLEKYHFTYQFTEGPAREGFKRAVCIVRHISGHEERGEYEAAIGVIENRDGKSVRSPEQDGLSAFSFACRIAFQNAFGIITAKADFQGQQAAFKATTLSGLADKTAAKNRLWFAVLKHNPKFTEWKQLYQWLVDEIDPNTPPINSLTVEQLTSLTERAERK